MYHSEVPPWEFDIRAVPPGNEPPEVSDWHRRHCRANATTPSMGRIAKGAFGAGDEAPTA